MLLHITIQELFAKYPEMHSAIANLGMNNYRHIFFIDPATENEECPTLYIMYSGQLAVIVQRDDRILLQPLSFKDEQALWTYALAQAHLAVEGKHPYLSKVLEETEIIWGIRTSPSNALF